MRPALPVAVALALLTGGCEPDKPDVVEANRAEAAKRAEQARETAREGSATLDRLGAFGDLDEETAATVLARVGERTITVGDVARYIARQPRYLRARYATADQRKLLLEHLVQLEILATEAHRRGLDRDPGVQHALKRALAEELLSSEVPLTGSVAEIPEEDVAAYYEAHEDEFVRPEQRRAARLVVYSEDEAEALHARIREALSEQPRMARQIFGDFVEDHSTDVEMANAKGDLGWFDEEGRSPEGARRVNEATVEQVWELDRIGAVSEPYAYGSDGWALVQLTNRRPRRVQDLEQVRLQIQHELLQERRVAARKAFIADLKEQARVEIHAEELERLDEPAAGETRRGGDRATEDANERSAAPPRLRPDPQRLRGRVDLRPGAADDRELPSAIREKLRMSPEEIQEKMRPREGEEGSR